MWLCVASLLPHPVLAIRSGLIGGWNDVGNSTINNRGGWRRGGQYTIH